MRTIVVGLGNPILTDDGVGVLVAYAVDRYLKGNCPTPDIYVTEASVGGLRLMELMVGFDRAILIDAYQGRDGAPPGTIHRMNLDDLRNASYTQHSASPHDTSVSTALDLGLRMGMHLPEKIDIFAVEVENVLDFNDTPTPAVAAVIPAVTEAVLEALGVNNGLS